jgi:hypothetical protein
LTGHPRLTAHQSKDVDARHKAGHDETMKPWMLAETSQHTSAYSAWSTCER